MRADYCFSSVCSYLDSTKPALSPLPFSSLASGSLIQSDEVFGYAQQLHATAHIQGIVI